MSITASRVCLSNLQTQAMVSLLCTVGTHNSIDIAPGQDSDAYGTVRVTVYRNGDATTWAIKLDGYTMEASA